jgi:type IV fimbrial biogenesis protein FimT
MQVVDIKAKGFTLVEMMITVAILGTLLAIALPQLSAFVARSRLMGTAEELQRDIQLARSEAVRINKPVLITVSSGATQCYGLSSKANACNCTVTNTAANNFCEIKRVSTSNLGSVTMTTGMDVALLSGGTTGTSGTSGNFSAVGFDPIRGMPFNTTNAPAFLANAQTIQLQNSANQIMQLVLSITGRITICSPNGSGFVPGYSNGC